MFLFTNDALIEILSQKLYHKRKVFYNSSRQLSFLARVVSLCIRSIYLFPIELKIYLIDSNAKDYLICR
jgi:hypothetical protein